MSLVILQVVSTAITVYVWLLIARAIMSWFPGLMMNPAMRPIAAFIHELTEPYLSLFRRVIPIAAVGGVGFDFSILIAIITLEVVRQFLYRLLLVFLS
ncbi:MAG: YggT family protein [Actinomycetota bacterium]